MEEWNKKKKEEWITKDVKVKFQIVQKNIYSASE
jgi:hypothetical protein